MKGFVTCIAGRAAAHSQRVVLGTLNIYIFSFSAKQVSVGKGDIKSGKMRGLAGQEGGEGCSVPSTTKPPGGQYNTNREH